MDATTSLRRHATPATQVVRRRVGGRAGVSSGEGRSLIEEEEREKAGLEEGKYRWDEYGVDIHYLVKKAQSTEDDAGSSSSPVLFLPGFGVGSFQFTSVMQEMGDDRDVFSFDWLGQGKSWPSDSEGLQFSSDLWVEQAATFIEDVIKKPVFLAGNSLGGYLGALLAARHPHLVKGVAMYNATPFWAFRPSADDDEAEAGAGRAGQQPQNALLARLFSTVWDGVLPAPKPYKEFASNLFDALRDEANVRRLLGLVYSSGTEAVLSRSFVKEIIDSAAHPEGPNAYASIVFSPKANIGFGEALEKGVQNGVSYLMVYGREDPWVVPLWGQRAYLRLRMAEQQQQQQHGDLQRVSYCELTPAGHCPHHEAPRTVGKVTEGWIRSMEREGREEEEQGGQHVTAGQVSTSTEIEKEQQQQQQKDDGQRSFPPLHREHGLMKERDGRQVRIQPIGDGVSPRNVGEWMGTLFLRQRARELLEKS